MKVSLIDLDADIETERIPAMTGGISDDGSIETLPAQTIITSIKVKGVELITLFSPEELQTMAEELQD